MNQTLEQLREHVASLAIFDTHEHVPGLEADRPMANDVLAEYLRHYFSCDLVSAGLAPARLEYARDPSGPLMERWAAVEPYWQAARHTGYGRALDIAAKGLYGIDRIDGKTIGELNEAFVAARAAGGTYQTVLKDKSRIRLSVIDNTPDCDRRFFRSTTRLDDFVAVANREQLDALARRAGARGIHCLADLEDACERALEAALAGGCICLKVGLAYWRPLLFEKVARSEAEAELAGLYPADATASPGAGAGGRRRLQDHMVHVICRLADARGLTVQVHTGIQEGNGNFIAHSDPVLLSNLFLEYPNARFDVFHIGYPYQQALGVLAKNFRNVFIDFCWAHIISPTASVRALAGYLDAVPANKISAFGGDYAFVDGIFGHQAMARDNVARALAIKVEEGAFGLDDAKHLAGMLLHDNPAALFDLARHVADE